MILDGDGYTGCSGDCDDLNALTYPGAAERDSETACMTDNDEDGYAAPQPLPGLQQEVIAMTQIQHVNQTIMMVMVLPVVREIAMTVTSIHTRCGTIESPTDCMTDVDNDGYGDENPAPGVTRF